jgi:hypothetical protein
VKLRFWKRKPKYEVRLPIGRRRDIVLHEPISGIISGISAWLSTSIGVAGITVGGMIKTVLIVAAIGSSIWSAIKKPSSQNSIENNGMLINTKSSSEPVKIIYGQVKVGGNWDFYEPTRENNEYFNVVIDWGEGEIEGTGLGVDFNPLFSGSGRNDLQPGGEFSNTSCTCNNTCYEYQPCSCNQTLYLYEGKGSCACYFECYNYQGCSCDQACYVNGEFQFKVQIDGTGTPDTFKWSDDGGSTWKATGVPITGEDQSLEYNIIVTFGATTGHTLNDFWLFWAGEGVWIGDRLLYYYTHYGGLNLASHELMKGTSDQDVLASLQAEWPAWNEAMQHTAYSYFRLIYNQDAFNSVPEFTIILKGRKLYDPRNGATVWSRNPALVWRDFLTSIRYGLGFDPSKIDDQSVKDAANWFDQEDYHFDGVVMDRQSFLDNMEEVLANMRAFVIRTGGIYKLKIFTDDAPVMILSADDVEGAAESFYLSQAGIPETPYKVKGIFADKEHNYTTNYAYSENTQMISITGDTKQIEIPLIGTTSMEQALKLVEYFRKRAAVNMEFHILCHPRFIAAEVGDMILLNHEFLNMFPEIITSSDRDSVITENGDILVSSLNMKKVRVKDIGLPQEGMVPITFMDEQTAIYS